MPASKLLITAVQQVLHFKARNGETTKNDATRLVMGKIDKAGGPTKFGIGAAAMRMALFHIIEVEVTRQLRMSLTEHEYKHTLPAGTPMEIIAALGKTPRWIAINEGVDAIWKFSLQASPDDWMANANLKYKKAHQTIATGRTSEEISLFLSKHEFNCLAEALTKGA